MRTTDVELAHGYTLAQVEHLARAAVNMAGQYASDYLDRLDAAHGGIVIALYEAPHWPTRYTLMDAGARAVHDLVRQTLHLRGYRDQSGYSGAGSSPRFAAFWTGMPMVTPSPENRIVERVAVEQVLPQLTPREKQAITALAATGDYQAGADLLGMGYDQFCNTVNRARRRAFALWHEHETPLGRWRTDKRIGPRTAVRPTHCPQNHPYDEQNTSHARNGALRCKRCHREREAARRAGTHQKKQLKPCGTYAAWQRHQYHGEPVDPACEAAAETYKASRRKAAA
ncbi:hypothetical protein [Micromonospora sp. NPDC023956]|uniref:hypothetical protein n=1 Tax=Micromonospora sp. NPDC023956 TaxID=3155722 RepID=UPI0033E032E7